MVATPANSINEATTGLTGFTGTAFVGTAATQYNVLVGGSTSSTISNVAPSATSGVPLVSGGASANPSFTTAVVAGGGTGQVTLTNHGVLIGAGTSAITQLAAGSAGQILRSGGASADPAYSTATYPATAGTSGNILTSDGTNIVSSAPAGLGGSLVLIQSQSPSNQASVTFTSGITATYNNYLLICSNVNSNSSGNGQVLQISTDGGSNYLGSGYLSGVTSNSYNSATISNANTTIGFYLFVNLASTAPPNNGNYYLFNMTSGNGYPMMTGQSFYNNSGVGYTIGSHGGAYNTGSTTVNAFRIVASAGNLTGTYTLYGIRSA